MWNERYYEEAKTIRRDLHRIPEAGLKEEKTRAYLIGILSSLGLSYRAYAQTGIACLLDMNAADTVAFRADMDGLPVTEETDENYASIHSGMMHACGHDGHMTMLILFAKYVTEQNIRLPRNVLLLFQPAEEGPGGASMMIKEGVLEDYHVSHVFGFHLTPDYPFGTIASTPGEFFASGVEYFIDVEGRSAHGAQPQKAKDAVLIASQLTVNLHTVISRSLNPLQDGVLTVGTFHAGDQINVTAGRAKLTGIVRAFNDETKELILSRLKQISRGIADAYECEIKVTIKYMYPPLINDKTLYERTKEILGNSFCLAEKVMLAEDFAYYTEEVPSLFMFLGFAQEGGSAYPLHNTKFNFDERVLIEGAKAYLALAQSERLTVE
ncbi:MAG: M20 family metallopeptidase [Anaerofustis sp.]